MLAADSSPNDSSPSKKRKMAGEHHYRNEEQQQQTEVKIGEMEDVHVPEECKVNSNNDVSCRTSDGDVSLHCYRWCKIEDHKIDHDDTQENGVGEFGNNNGGGGNETSAIAELSRTGIRNDDER